MTLATSTALSAGTAANVSFDSTLGGTFGLTATAGNVTFDGSVSIASLTTGSHDDQRGPDQHDGRSDQQRRGDAGHEHGPLGWDGRQCLVRQHAGRHVWPDGHGRQRDLRRQRVDRQPDPSGGHDDQRGPDQHDGRSDLQRLAATLATSTALSAGTAANVSFDSTLGGTFGLTATAGNVTFDGSMSIASLTHVGATTINAAHVNTTGDLGPTERCGDAGHEHGPLGRHGRQCLVRQHAGRHVWPDGHGRQRDLRRQRVDRQPDPLGATTINAAHVNTTGDQTYNGAVTLATSTALSAGTAANVSFDSTLGGTFGLTATAGNVTFDGSVSIASLTHGEPRRSTRPRSTPRAIRPTTARRRWPRARPSRPGRPPMSRSTARWAARLA